MTWGLWGWLLGVNTAAALLPIGALANLLWLRIMGAEGAVEILYRRELAEADDNILQFLLRAHLAKDVELVSYTWPRVRPAVGSASAWTTA